MRFRDIAVVLAVPGPGAAGTIAGPVDLSQAWALPAAAGADTSVMMTLHNEGQRRDDLVRAACAGTESAALVGPGQPGTANRRIESVPLPGGATVQMTPQGLHLVVTHLDRQLGIGDVLHCTATFVSSGERLFHAAVRTEAPPVLPPT